MLLKSLCLKRADNGLGIADRPKILDDDGVVRSNEDNGGVVANTILVANAGPAAVPSDGGIFHAVVVCPVETGFFVVTCVHFHIKHIMHVAAHGLVGLDHVRDGLDAGRASGEEKVKKHILSVVENVKQMHFGAVNVSNREVNGGCKWTLRLHPESQGQRNQKK